jgi:hypothetical protein
MSNVTTFTLADFGFINDMTSVTESGATITIDCTGLRTDGSCAFLVTAISTTTNKRAYLILHLASNYSSFVILQGNAGIVTSLSMTPGGILTFSSGGESFILNCLPIC